VSEHNIDQVNGRVVRGGHCAVGSKSEIPHKLNIHPRSPEISENILTKISKRDIKES
jgi:hypothetical protein